MVTSGASPSSAVAMRVASLRGATGILSHHPPLPSTTLHYFVFFCCWLFLVELRNGEINQHAKAPPQILGRLKHGSWKNNNCWWRRDATTQESVQIKRIVKRKMSLENGLRQVCKLLVQGNCHFISYRFCELEAFKEHLADCVHLIVGEICKTSAGAGCLNETCDFLMYSCLVL